MRYDRRKRYPRKGNKLTDSYERWKIHMNKVHKQQDEGFTIIEVVLVLAIAALILLMVFLALPALQRGQRDTQRKNDVSRLQSSLNNYKSGARGQLPTSSDLTNDSYLSKYLRKGNDTFADPSGDNYRLVQITTNGTVPAWSEDITENIYFSKGGTCGDGQTPTAPNSEGSRRMNLVKPLEGGGVQCVEV